LGTPTVLINCAVKISSNQTLLETPLSTLQTDLSTNLLGPIITIKQFLPAMLALQRGHIITVSSALAFISPARLTAYAASKSALVALHESLTAELGLTSPVKTLLVCPGQLYTPLFFGVHTPSYFLAPVLEPVAVAREILKAVEANEGGEWYGPWYVQFLWCVRGLPSSLAWLVRWLGGVDRAMEDWCGHDGFNKELNK
jgi:short-subunit dehydrogenase